MHTVSHRRMHGEGHAVYIRRILRVIHCAFPYKVYGAHSGSPGCGVGRAYIDTLYPGETHTRSIYTVSIPQLAACICTHPSLQDIPRVRKNTLRIYGAAYDTSTGEGGCVLGEGYSRTRNMASTRNKLETHSNILRMNCQFSQIVCVCERSDTFS